MIEILYPLQIPFYCALDWFNLVRVLHNVKCFDCNASGQLWLRMDFVSKEDKLLGNQCPIVLDDGKVCNGDIYIIDYME